MEKTTGEVHPKTWGYETWITNTPLFCSKLLHLKQGWACSIHYHKLKTEHFHVLKGEVAIQLADDDELLLLQGEGCWIPPNSLHRFVGIIDSVILETSTQHFEDDSYRIIESMNMDDPRFEGWSTIIVPTSQK